MDKIGYLGIVLEWHEGPPGRQVRTSHCYILHDRRVQQAVDHHTASGMDQDDTMGALVVAHVKQKHGLKNILANWLLQQGPGDRRGFLFTAQVNEQGMPQGAMRLVWLHDRVTVEEGRAAIMGTMAEIVAKFGREVA
jgi:hypothetical protein